MSVSKETLLELKQNAVNKRQQLFEMLQQANGAIDVLDYLLQQIEQSNQEHQDGDAI